jgi:hypothetical protein
MMRQLYPCCERVPLAQCTVPPRLGEILTAPAPLRFRVMHLLFWVSDHLCAHRWTFEAGHWAGELGWRFRTQPSAPMDGRG